MSRYSQKDQANRQLAELTTPRGRTEYFESVPIREMLEILDDAGFKYDPDDGAMILCGREGSASVDLTLPGSRGEYGLHFTWYKMPVSGRYEIVAYVS